MTLSLTKATHWETKYMHEKASQYLLKVVINSWILSAPSEYRSISQACYRVVWSFMKLVRPLFKAQVCVHQMKMTDSNKGLQTGGMFWLCWWHTHTNCYDYYNNNVTIVTYLSMVRQLVVSAVPKATEYSSLCWNTLSLSRLTNFLNVIIAIISCHGDHSHYTIIDQFH